MTNIRDLVVSSSRSRVFASALLFLLLVVLESVAGEAFPLLVSIALVVAPLINWRAYKKLQRQHEVDPTISSLRSALHTAQLLSIASFAIAAVGLFVLLRVLELVPPITREQFLVGLSFPLLLMTGPAIEWLRFRVWPTTEAKT